MQILIVGDSISTRNLLSQMLAHCGYNNCIDINSGLAAFEIVKQRNIDIILMDILTSNMNRHTTTKIIKQHAGDNHIPIIFITEISGTPALKETLECGADDYIEKPLNLEIVESKICVHVRIRKLTRNLHVKNNELLNQNGHLQHEHELVSCFFDNALGHSHIDKRCIHYRFSPMSVFNGDLMLSRRSPSGRLYLLLGDFTGHGLTAAIGTLPVSQVFLESTKKDLCVGDLARKINTALKNLLPENLFFAATIVEINPTGMHLELWNGGMPLSVIASQDGNRINTLESQHMPLGILDECEFEANTTQYSLNKGDRLLLYTDGIVETRNTHGEEFGEQRLHSLFCETGDHLFDMVYDKLTSFRKDINQQDDISLVEVLCDNLPEIIPDYTETTSFRNKLPWHLSTTLDKKHIRTKNPISGLVDTLDTALSLGKHKGLIYTILYKVYNDVLDCSILGLHRNDENDDNSLLKYYNKREKALSELQEAYIKFNIIFAPNKNAGTLLISLQDSGNSLRKFYINNKFPRRKEIGLYTSYWKGQSILSDLCTVIKIDDQANLIELQYQLC